VTRNRTSLEARRRDRAAVFAIWLCAWCVLATAACGGGSGTSSAPPASPAQPVTESATGVTIDLVSPDPPASGDNAFEVTVTQADGMPLTDATVAAVFSMPAMPSMNMPAMRTDVPLTHAGGGSYRGAGNLAMGGTWNVAITVTKDGAPVATKKFSVIAK
jgi:hypothetical protein